MKLNLTPPAPPCPSVVLQLHVTGLAFGCQYPFHTWGIVAIEHVVEIVSKSYMAFTSEIEQV